MLRDRDGDQLDGQGLEWDEHRVDLSWDRYWDDAKQWRSKTLLRARDVADNGQGYQDFVMLKAAQKLTYHKDDWTITGEASFSHYDYPVQTVESGDPRLRQRSRLGLGVEVLWDVANDWQVSGRYDFEDYQSNSVEDEYEVHVWSLGLSHTF